LLTPYTAFELVSRLKEMVSLPIALHSHATTGMSVATLTKAAEAGVDMVDTAISSMSMTYSHSATESLVAIMDGTQRSTGLDLKLLEEIATYFREVRRKYARFEGALKGVDSRILVAQVPGGMLTNMENQLKEQGAGDKLDQVLEEIPRVRRDLGYIPLVTPTSQIVGTQAVINVLTGEPYKSLTKETTGILKGEYGATPAPVNPELQARVLADGEEPVTCRPADLIPEELDTLSDEFNAIAGKRGIQVAGEVIEDVLIYALFPQVGLKFLENRNDPSAFEPAPGSEPEAPAAAPAPAAAAGAGQAEQYRVMVNGRAYEVEVAPGGGIARVEPAAGASGGPARAAAGSIVPSPLAGTIFRINVSEGSRVAAGDVVMILEAMKMETEVRSPNAGTVQSVAVKEGDTVQVGDPLLTLV
ncbi:MAG TPA: pyruvate carboxylase subunit B, partial [Sedimenticola sp.]|nr:pyruvate carboxylase subunit B [Sedimenticola sp.]